MIYKKMSRHNIILQVPTYLQSFNFKYFVLCSRPDNLYLPASSCIINSKVRTQGYIYSDIGMGYVVMIPYNRCLN